MTLSTHVLDVEAGRPAAGIGVVASRFVDGEWVAVAGGTTDGDGRIGTMVDADGWEPGRWRLVFAVAEYHGPDAFWPSVTLEFRVAEATHHHVPLLLARHGYSTYRGS